VLPEANAPGKFDDRVVQQLLNGVDFIAMLAITPGVSAEALHLCSIGNGGPDNMLVYMPQEYRDGYIYDLLERRHKARIRSFALEQDREKLGPDLCKKVFWDALTTALDKQVKQQMAPSFSPTIGIVTALPKELAAVREILTDQIPDNVRKPDGLHQYVHGTIVARGGGEHKVVLALGGKGNNYAAISATNLLRDFPTVEEVFMVGIAAGVPNPSRPADHVRLGDIVIADGMGVIQYDNVKVKTNSVQYSAAPRPPSADWIRLADSEIVSMADPPPYWGYLDKMLADRKISRPRADLLNDSPWGKKGSRIRHPQDDTRPKKRPKIHQGPIGSGNTVLKKASVRNALRERFSLRAVEMEGSGIADAAWTQGKGYMVVRGICDYANDLKADEWQEYAACAAAAFTRQLIEAMPLRKSGAGGY
jgi:nucleoside phosphorylase